MKILCLRRDKGGNSGRFIRLRRLWDLSVILLKFLSATTPQKPDNSSMNTDTITEKSAVDPAIQGASGGKPPEAAEAPTPAPLEDDFQQELAALVHPLRGLPERRAEKFRPILRCLLDAGKPADECYQRLRATRMSRPQASRFARLVSCRSVADQFLAGALPWDTALVQARQASPGAPKKTPEDLRDLAVQRFVALLLKYHRTEFAHPAGLFRLIEIDAPLAPSPTQNENERNTEI